MHERRRSEAEVERQVRFHDPPARCPYCHDGCGADDDLVVCRGCLARHHRECWDAGGACAACGGERGLGEAHVSAGAGQGFDLDGHLIAREPAWLRRVLAAFFLGMTVVCLAFGAYVLSIAPARMAGPGEWLVVLPLALVMTSLFPAWFCWRSARLRLWPVVAAESAAKELP